MVLVFSPYEHPKLHFALSEIFVRRASIPYQITCNADFFIHSAHGFKVNYSEDELPGIRMYNSGWLDHQGLDPYFKPAFSLQNGLPSLFPDTGNSRFDLFAACFWLLSRYEEYQPFQGDAYGRFCLRNSCLPAAWATNNHLDIQIRLFLETLGLEQKNAFRVVPTADIDIAFKYLARPLLIRMGGFLRDLLFRREHLAERRSMNQGGRDPYDVFAWICAAFRPFPDARIFWQMNRSRNGLDRQVNIRDSMFLQRLRECSAHITPGIHPSWDSNSMEQQLTTEIKALESACGQHINHSRQHFLACRFPDTFRRLNEAGIQWDYTLGWPEQPGFRAGTAWPFAFYDVLRDRQEALNFMPSCAMDVSYKNYLSMSAEQAAAHGNMLKEKARSEGGVFCFIVHNESMSNIGPWKGWQQVAEAWMS